MFPLFPSGEYHATVVFSCFKELRYIYLTIFLRFMERHDIAAQYSRGSGFETRPGAEKLVVLFSYSRWITGPHLKIGRNVIYTRFLVLLGQWNIGYDKKLHGSEAFLRSRQLGSPPLFPIQSKINPVHTTLSYLSKIHLNFILLPTSRSS
jgi:hypothetical protein